MGSKLSFDSEYFDELVNSARTVAYANGQLNGLRQGMLYGVIIGFGVATLIFNW